MLKSGQRFRVVQLRLNINMRNKTIFNMHVSNGCDMLIETKIKVDKLLILR
jgi:hypothetical protein